MIIDMHFTVENWNIFFFKCIGLLRSYHEIEQVEPPFRLNQILAKIV